jgi:hypothetical protein
VAAGPDAGAAPVGAAADGTLARCEADAALAACAAAGATCWTGGAGGTDGATAAVALPGAGWPTGTLMRSAVAALAAMAAAAAARAGFAPAGRAATGAPAGWPSAPPIPGRKASMRNSVIEKPAYSSGASPSSFRPCTAI